MMLDRKPIVAGSSRRLTNVFRSLSRTHTGITGRPSDFEILPVTPMFIMPVYTTFEY